MLFKNKKLDKIKTGAYVSQVTPKHHRQINRSAEKCKVEEVRRGNIIGAVTEDEATTVVPSRGDVDSGIGGALVVG
ncbi:hypothetical protein U1Q18_031952 [Sarracenia purpurea var. burkii]